MSRQTDEAVLTGCLTLVLTWVLGWGTGALRALVAMKGWEWFVEDTFNAPPLGFVPAWGFFYLVSFATMRPPSASGEGKESPVSAAVAGLFGSVVLSGFAFASLLILAGFR